MRISRIAIKNYRQFRDVEIPLRQNSEKDMHIVIGVMGTGKTNILNAVNWCLYGDEPHLSKDSQQLPRLNLAVIEETADDEDQEVVVEIWAETEDRRRMIFTRKEIFRVYEVGDEPSLRESIFELKITHQDGNTEILRSDEEITPYVERFVPRRIREFFFFDGERLDKYFREATGQHIRQAIFGVSQIDTLERMEKNLSKVLKDFRKEAGRQSPEIELTREALERKEKRVAELLVEVGGCREQITIAKEKVEEYRENLRGVPKIRQVQKEREKLKETLTEKQELLEAKIKEKNELIFERAKVLLIYEAIEKSRDAIEEKRRRKELPPTIDEKLLKGILKNMSCICGRPFSEGSEEERKIEAQLKSIEVTSEVAQELLKMEGTLSHFVEVARRARERIQKVGREISRYESDIEEIDARVSEINGIVKGYNIERIKEWHEEQMKFERILTDSLPKLGILRKQREECQREAKDLEQELEEELKKEVRMKELRRYIEFTSKALSAVKDTKEEMMDRIRAQIEKKTKDIFFSLIWKKETFKDVTIDDDYAIHLLHSLGYECLGTISGGEREVLALSFTMALHEVSGFDSPILIDRPLAMVSGDPVKNIADIFARISGERQIVLLLTPNDYTDEVSRILERDYSNKYQLSMAADEKSAGVVG